MAGILDSAMAWLRAPGNAVAFGVRSRVGWSRGEAVLPHEEKGEMGELFAHLPGEVARRALAIERELCARYELDALRARSTRVVWRDGLVRLHAMERMLAGVELPVSGDGVLRAVDAGCGAFHYASVLQRFFARFGATSAEAQPGNGASRRRVVLRGLEVDGHGVYRDGHSRADHARAHARLAGEDVHFQVADFAHANLPEQDVVTAWFPFVTRYALLRWGLPLSLFAPQRYFERAAKVVRKGGLLVVVNQTEGEAERVDALTGGLPFERVAHANLATPWADGAETTLGWTGSVFVQR